MGVKKETAGVALADPPPPAERIRDSAKHLFAANGYEHTTTSAIARAAGTSESQLVKYFGGKLGLLRTIFDLGWERIAEQIRHTLENLHDPVEKLQAVVSTVVTALEKDPEFKLLVLVEGRRMRKETHAVAFSDGFIHFVRLVDAVIIEMQKENRLRPNLRPQAVRSALIGMVEGLLRDHFLSTRTGIAIDYDLCDLANIFRIVVLSFTNMPSEQGDAAHGT